MSAVLEDLLRTKAAEAMDLDAYVGLFEQVVVEGRSTGPVQTEDYVAYTKLNLARWRRVQKTMALLPGAGEVLRGTAPLTWLVISEPWCGDAAQVVPVLATMAAQMPGSELRLVLRDEQPELMDRYLTNGGRSIPKLIAIDRESGAERFSWGPRPQAAQELVLALREVHQGDWKAVVEELHRWYHADATRSTQREILELLQAN
jgi:hypothetical protein